MLNYFIGMKGYGIKPYKVAIYIVLSALAGVGSTMIMSFIESGSFMGTSFYGAVFLMPIFALIMSKILKIPAYQIFNITAVFGIMTSAILKFRCFSEGCCGGRRLMNPFTKEFFIFPSQISEMIFAIVLFVLLLFLLYKNKDRKDTYPILMILYGVGRFFFNTLRYTTPVFMGLANGHLWSILCVIIGIIWWSCIPSEKKKNEEKQIAPQK
jgi:prolipoprotein diacylglyceryltransferase